MHVKAAAAWNLKILCCVHAGSVSVIAIFKLLLNLKKNLFGHFQDILK